MITILEKIIKVYSYFGRINRKGIKTLIDSLVKLILIIVHIDLFH